ncbi:MAG: ornithine cyclodeaminase family protein [Thermaerobacter sp.]|nr:ornithine cyclodeaminase family protein [Thermaerobacter sp.]
MALLIREADVTKLLSMGEAITAVREALQAQGQGSLSEQPRRRVMSQDAVLSGLFASHPKRNLIGGKVYVASKAGVARFLIPIWDQRDAKLLALIEGDHLGQMRTGAISAVATDLLARKDAARLGMIGAGYQAETQLEAIALVRPLQRATVYARNRERLEAFCRRMTDRIGVPVAPAVDARDAVVGQDVIVTITGAKETVLFGRDLAPGQHVNAAGSNRAHDREIDDDAVLRAKVVAVDSRATAEIEAGDVIPLLRRGALRLEDLPTLGEIQEGVRPGRQSPEDVTLFLSQGIAALDLAAGAVVLEKARAAGLGQEVDFLS